MQKKGLRSQCEIQKPIKVICPFCEQIIAIPMHKAVNGETIECYICGKSFVFRQDS